MTIMEQTLVVTVQYDSEINPPPDGWDWPSLLDHDPDMLCVTAVTAPAIVPTEEDERDLLDGIVAGATALAENPALTVEDVVKKLTGG